MENIETLVKDLPDIKGARRFYAELVKMQPGQSRKLEKDQGLLSDVLTISSYSPLLATTILQNPDYITWLKRQRKISGVKEKDELLESLAQFAMTNSGLETNVLLARFRRRELIRIYLKDIRRLGTITEVTEEISNLADAILEYSLRIARQELDNRYGTPLEIDEKDRSKPAKFVVVALGKLGSKELNYSSDIDLLFLYSTDGSTSGHGSRGVCSNKQYFVKLSEFIAKLVGDQKGEGAAYRVDMRLRPHGRVGALAITLNEAINYYTGNSAQMWEKQVLIRSRAAAGDPEIYNAFFAKVSPSVFSSDITVGDALRNVRISKEKIDTEKYAKNGFDVKLGKGGIREIEFIAQALQLAFGGKDPWLRSPHTLISLSRVADRKLITELELTQLFEAYEFLRRLEHNVQMENGLQTHFIPDDIEKRLLIAQRMGIHFVADFNKQLDEHCKAVTSCFTRIFGEEYIKFQQEIPDSDREGHEDLVERVHEITPLLTSIEKSDAVNDFDQEKLNSLKLFIEIAPPFAEMLATSPKLAACVPLSSATFGNPDYKTELTRLVGEATDYPAQLSVLRNSWARFMVEIAALDAYETLDRSEIKTFQTSLAEASIHAAMLIARKKLSHDLGQDLTSFDFGVLGLGKLGGGGMDYGSDLDLVLIFDDKKPSPVRGLTSMQVYSKAAETFVTALSSLTRDGSLYRVDLRLRPDGKNGATVIGHLALINYLEKRAAIWEWLAYVKLRGVPNGDNFAEDVERKCRNAIHLAAAKREKIELKQETKRIRDRLEQEKSGSKQGKEIDIKFGEGSLQDVYFTVRYLQLKDSVMDDISDRSTQHSLKRLFKNKSLSDENYSSLSDGYEFLSAVDHSLRLTVGRSTRLPLGNKKSLKLIADRMKLESVDELLEKLTFYRLAIRAAFEEILGDV